MDDIVKAALAKWPHVPHCHGWLALDARGDWYLRDAPTQAAGPFPQVKGSRIVHDKLLAFIQRNYAHDEHGAWFFQNGPQRVYTDLGFGLVHSLDMGLAAQAVDSGAWDPAELPFAEMPARFGYVLRPQEKAAPGAASSAAGRSPG